MLSQRLRELSFLNAGIRIQIEDERTDRSHDFCYEGGIVSFVEYLNKSRTPLHRRRSYVSGERRFTQGSREVPVSIEIAIQYNETYNESVYSFANNINTVEGGSHLIGFRTALTRAINRYIATQQKNGKSAPESISGDDVREGLTAVISVKLPQPEFEGQTKTKLGTSEVRGLVEGLLYDRLLEYLEENPPTAPAPGQQDHRQRPGPGRGAEGPRSRAPEGRPRRPRPAGQAGRLSGARPQQERALHRRGRLRRRLRQAGALPRDPGGAAAARQDPERRARAPRPHALERPDPVDGDGARLQRRRRLRRRQGPLPPRHHHDRRGRGRQPHPHAAADLLLPADAGADRPRLPLHRAAAALQGQEGPQRALHQGRAHARGLPARSRPRERPDRERLGGARPGAQRASCSSSPASSGASSSASPSARSTSAWSRRRSGPARRAPPTSRIRLGSSRGWRPPSRASCRSSRARSRFRCSGASSPSPSTAAIVSSR